MTRHLSFVIAFALCSSIALPSIADDTTPRKPLAESLSGDAKTDYEAAKLLFEDGDFTGASSKFRQAYDRSKDPRLLWNVAVCEKGLRHYVKVQSLVVQYLAEGKDVLSPEQTRAARALQEAVKAFVGTLKVEAEPGTALTVDGEPAPPTPHEHPIVLDLGAHKLGAERSGFKPFTSPFEIKGGEETAIKVVMLPTNAKAHLSVQAAEGDSIAFDGTVVGITRWQADVDPGPHALRVTAPKRKAYELRVDLAEGSNRSVEVTLENEPRALWPWIIGGAVVLVSASIGGYFLFKPGEVDGEQPKGTLDPGIVNLASWR